MKKTFIILLFLSSHICTSQSWTFKSGVNAFDGEYRTASVIGEANNFPYNSPLMVVNLFNEESLNFYVANAGYFPSRSKLYVFIVLNNEPNEIYKANQFDVSLDGNKVFFESFIKSSSNEELGTFEFLEKLKKANYIDVRFSDYDGKNDVRFSLSGSSKAIDFVVAKVYQEYKQSLNIEKKKEQELKEKSLKDHKVLSELILDYGIEVNDEMVRELLEIVYNGFSEEIELSKIDSIGVKIIPKGGFSFNVFEGDKALESNFYLDIKTSKFLEAYLQNENEKDLFRIKEILRDKGLDSITISEASNDIIYKANKELGFSLSGIDRIEFEEGINNLGTYSYYANIILYDKERYFEKVCEIPLTEYSNKRSEEYKLEGFKIIERCLIPYKLSSEETQTIISKINKYASSKLLKIVYNKVDSVDLDPLISRNSLMLTFFADSDTVTSMMLNYENLDRSLIKKLE